MRLFTYVGSPSSSSATGNWLDQRASKSAKGPDFKTNDGKKALWLTSKFTPSWVPDRLGELAGMQEGRSLAPFPTIE